MHCIIIKECIKIHVAKCIFIHLKIDVHSSQLFIIICRSYINIKLVSKIQTKMTATVMSPTLMTATKMTGHECFNVSQLLE